MLIEVSLVLGVQVQQRERLPPHVCFQKDSSFNNAQSINFTVLGRAVQKN